MAPRLAAALSVCLACGQLPPILTLRPAGQGSSETPPAVGNRIDAVVATAQVDSLGVVVLAPGKTEAGDPSDAASAFQIPSLDGVSIDAGRSAPTTAADIGAANKAESARSLPVGETTRQAEPAALSGDAAGEAERKAAETPSPVEATDAPQAAWKQVASAFARPSLSLKLMEVAENDTMEVRGLSERRAKANRRAKGHAAPLERTQAAVAASSAAVGESSAVEVTRADAESDADDHADFLPFLACVENPQGQRIGCKGVCACMWWEQCYTRRNTEKPFEDTGVCEMSMKVMAFVTIVISLALLLITLSSRIILQEREIMRAKWMPSLATKGQNWDARATMRDNLYAMHGKAGARVIGSPSRKRGSI